MKRGVILLVLIFLLLVGVVSATLTKTRIYGKADPSVIVKLTLSYSANGLPVDSQFIKVDTDNSGDWEYKLGSDEGTIELEVTILGVTKTFAVPVGPDFEVSMNDEDTEETTADENTTEETSDVAEETTADEETTEETTETAEETTEGEGGAEETNGAEESVEADVELSEGANKKNTETSAISGQATLGDKLDLKGSSSIILIILILFITIVIANIFSEFLISGFRRVKEGRADKTPIRVIKLSEKLEKAKKKLEQAKETEKSIQEQLKRESQGHVQSSYQP